MVIKGCHGQVILMLILFSLSSCTVRYKTQGFSAKIDEQVAKIKEFKNQLNGIKTKALATYEKTKGNPRYQEIKGEMDYLSSYYQKVVVYEKAVIEKSNALKQALHGKDSVSSKDPAYQMMKDYRSYLESVQKDLVQNSKKMETVQRKFTEYIKVVGIYEIKTAEMRAQLTNSLKEMDKKIKNARDKLVQAASLVPKLQKKWQELKKKNIKNMKELLKTIEGQKKAVSTMAQNFYQEVKDKGEKVKIYPDMKSHGILKKLQEHVNKIKELSSQFNSEAEQFKTIPKDQ